MAPVNVFAGNRKLHQEFHLHKETEIEIAAPTLTARWEWQGMENSSIYK